MAVGEAERPTQKHRRKMPSFSSSLLDAIYHSIDDPLHPHPHHLRRNAADEEIESLRRAIMIEKWIENYSTTAAASSRHHLPSNSASSTDSSIFTSSETTTTTDSSSTPKPAPFKTKPDRENRFSRTKSKALKIYGDLKKVKEPISPGGRIANFLNSIFSPRNLNLNLNLKRENNININPDWSSVRKSRSMKDTTTTTSTPCSLQSRSCLTKNTNNNPSKNNKSKRSVRFCPVSVILDDEDHDRSFPAAASMAAASGVVGSRFIKKNIDTIRMFENNDHRDFDDKSCASSDLFELENFGAFDAELPVYGTTDLRINRGSAFATRV